MAQRYREQTARFRQLGLTIPALKRAETFHQRESLYLRYV